MKKIFTSAAIMCSLFIACNSNEQTTKHAANDSSNESSSEKEKKISKRDYSINRANAYNDIFMDSNTVEAYITQKKLPDSISRRIRSFYNTRNYQFAWFSSTGLAEQALAFWNIHNYEIYTGDTSLKNITLQKKMDDLIADSSLKVSASDKSIINTELMLTEHFIKHTLENYEKGYVKRKEMERFIPVKKEEPINFADSLINKKHKDEKYYDDVNNSYKLLKQQLIKYVDIAKNGGWPQINADAKQFKKGASSPSIAALKRHLQITGDMPAGDTSRMFDDTLVNGIKQFQNRLGYKPNGTITATIIKDLNVPVEKRIEQILVNLNRMRWMPQEPEGKLILVNIPEFELHFLDGKNKIFDMDVVVGKEGHNTMMFTGKLSTIVFSPYWNVPPSIVKKEIMPHMASNPNYLASQNMEVTGNAGGLPVIRQLPGEKNSLGKVKFLFPNSFNIYFHDTPAKGLFNQDKRAYSHGCVRLSDPLKMAEYLLKDNSEWPPEKIIDAMNSGNEKFVKIKDPVPVIITYYTAWVDENGQLNFRDDIYKRDATMMQKMFVAK
ncbi:MAG: L,D-transpeptidase family protein [Bacteroidota bacterium]|nr:L,D-transpeptidase family protein [Bacteroidota bacterium]